MSSVTSMVPNNLAATATEPVGSHGRWSSSTVSSLCVLDKGLNRLAVGASMIPRGEVGLIFAGVGSSAMVSGEPLFSAETFSAIVAIVMVTTLLAPPLIKRAFGRGSHRISRPQATQA